MDISRRLSEFRRQLSGAPPREDERLLQLYWNRAELKKEFLRLQDENYALREKLRKQQAHEQQQQEWYKQLEDFLGQPDSGPPALVYFQLRRLWKLGAERLQRFSEQLRRQQEERERHQQLMEFDQMQLRKLSDVKQRMLDAQSYADAAEARVKMTEKKYASLRGFWNYFRRRKLVDEIGRMRVQLEMATGTVVDITEELGAVKATPKPVFSGLSLEGRRLVNTATIAYAQWLVNTYSVTGLVYLAKDAMAKQPLVAHYGGREECARIMTQLRSALTLIVGDDVDLQALRSTTEQVRAQADYRGDADTVPLTESIADLPIKAEFIAYMESMGRHSVNVLLDDYWDVYRALVR